MITGYENLPLTVLINTAWQSDNPLAYELQRSYDDTALWVEDAIDVLTKIHGCALPADNLRKLTKEDLISLINQMIEYTKGAADSLNDLHKEITGRFYFDSEGAA